MLLKWSIDHVMEQLLWIWSSWKLPEAVPGCPHGRRWGSRPVHLKLSLLHFSFHKWKVTWRCRSISRFSSKSSSSSPKGLISVSATWVSHFTAVALTFHTHFCLNTKPCNFKLDLKVPVKVAVCVLCCMFGWQPERVSQRASTIEVSGKNSDRRGVGQFPRKPQLCHQQTDLQCIFPTTKPLQTSSSIQR